MKGKLKETLHVLARIHDFPTELFDETKRLTILIVDDEIDYLELIERYVSSFGYDCLTAEDGVQALECLRCEHIDMVISDIRMPNMDGMELLKRIQDEFPHVVTMIFSGYGKEYTFKEIIQAGACEFIEKPVNKEVLEAKIERVFREKMLMASYINEIKTQKILVELLALSARNQPISELLHAFLRCITTFPWLELEPQGAVLLVDEKDKNRLLMMAHHNLAEPLQELCSQVPFGHCLCGLAAQTKEVIFSDHVGKAHHNRYEGILEHGHYCVPLIQADGELLGVFTLYVKAGTIYNREAELMLKSAAQTLAGLIASKQSDARNAESEHRYRAMTDSVLDGIIMMDANGAISFWNQAAQRIFGYTVDEAMGRDLHELLCLEQQHRDHARNALPLFLATGQGKMIGKTVELIAKGKDGGEIPVELSLSGLKTQGEWHAVGVVRDVTARKMLEKEKDLLNIKLRQAQKMEAIGTLAGGIAHDFNNILGAVIGFADMAKDEVPADSQVHSDLDRILTAGYRAKDLVNQILTFSRQKEEEFIPTHIHLILKEALKLLRATIPVSIDMEQKIDSKCAAVMVDPTQLHQVIMNLCTNAAYAMRKGGGKRSIALEDLLVEQERNGFPMNVPPGHYVKFTVSDSGEGMNGDVLQHIFEPYFTTKPQGEGTGLGLSLVHGIILELKGALLVQSEPGKGTVFEIFFPALDAQFSSAHLQDAVETLPGGHERLLLVDDETSLVETTARRLSKLGYAVTARTSSIEALQAFKANPYKFDLVITDLAMPNMTGLDMAAEMLKLRSDLPVLLVTGFADALAVEYAQKIGIKKIVSKPIDLREITAVMRQVLGDCE